MNRELVRWEPFENFFGLSGAVGELWNRVPDYRQVEGELHFAPPLEVKEHDKTYQVQLDIPGIAKEDVKVEWDEGTLRVSGERRTEKAADEKSKYHFNEVTYGKFTRAVRFGEEVDSEKVEAVFKDGVLSVTVPKSEKAKPRLISVRDDR